MHVASGKTKKNLSQVACKAVRQHVDAAESNNKTEYAAMPCQPALATATYCVQGDPYSIFCDALFALMERKG